MLQLFRTLVVLAAFTIFPAQVFAADDIPMPFQVGAGYADPTRPGVTVPALSDYIKQLYASDDARTRALGDGLCTVRYTKDGKPSADVPIVDFWQENKDLVALMLVERKFLVLCDWTTKPDRRNLNADRALCRQKNVSSIRPSRPAAKVPAYWYCRPCPPNGGCPKP